jgi:hypothetical protein
MEELGVLEITIQNTKAWPGAQNEGLKFTSSCVWIAFNTDGNARALMRISCTSGGKDMTWTESLRSKC